MLTCILGPQSFAQIQNRFLLYDVNSGLSQNSVTCFFEDSKGLIWVGTQDGLNSFDGRSFNHYSSLINDRNTLSNKYILKIAEDKTGNLWIGTAFGLNKLNTQTGKVQRVFINHQKELAFSISPYEFFYIDKSNTLKLLRNQKLYSIDCKSLQIKEEEGTSIFHLFNNLPDGGAYLWRNDSLVHLENKEQSISLNHQLDPKSIFRIRANREYAIFLTKSPNQVVHILDLHKKRLLGSIKVNEKIFDLHITDSSVQLSTEKGFKVYQGITLKDEIYYDALNPQSIPSGPVLCSYVDSKHNLWLGTSSSGIAVQPITFNYFNQIANRHKKDAIQDINSYAGKTWLAANTGVYYLNQNAMQLVKSFSPNRVNAVCYWNGLLYASVEQNGIYVLTTDGKIKANFRLENSVLESNQVFALQAFGNRLGICSEKHFYLLSKNNHFQKITVNASSGTFSYILDCHQDEKGDIYLATNNGIAKVDTLGHTLKIISSIHEQDALGKTIISSVTSFHDSLLVSTLDNGIFLLKNYQVVQHYYFNHGLPNNVTYNVVKTNGNHLWACTNAGISRMASGEKNFTQISQSHGLPMSYYSFGSIEEKDNRVYIGTDQGLFICHDSSLKIQPIWVQPYIDKVSVNGKSINFNVEKIEIDVYKKSLEIQFGHETSFDPILFAYQLNNAEWEILPINQKRINFSSFPFGKNTLKIKCAGSTSEMKKAKISSYVIYASTPWHLRWYMVLLFSLMVGFIIYSMVAYYFKQKSEKRIRIYEGELKLQLERERISKDLHDNLGSYATALLSKIQQMKKGKENRDLDDMHVLGNHIISNIRETIWIMQTKDIKIQDFSDKIKNYILKLKTIYPSLQIKVDDEIDQNVTLSPTITTHLFRIIQEAIQNCVKHAQASVLDIHFKSYHGITIRITDNGIGYSPNEEGEHYGVQNMQQRATEMGFTFEIGKSVEGTLIELREKL